MGLGHKLRAEKNNMALFSRKPKPSSVKTTEGKEETPRTASSLAHKEHVSEGTSQVLQQARITEKATMHSDAGVYTFNVAESATKRDIVSAVRALYKVTPRKVAIVSIPSKVRRNMRTGKIGMKHGGKKAYVYLKKGETITIS